MKLDLAFNETEQLLKKSGSDYMKRFATKNVIQKLQESDTGYTPELWKEAGDMGWFGILIPEQYGGSGNNLTAAAALFEELGTGPLPGPFFNSAVLSALILMEAGSEDQKKKYLPLIASGEKIFTLALTEPSYSWEPEAIELSAAKKGSDYLLDGTKLFVPDAKAADYLIVVARTGKEAGAKGIGVFVVDSKVAGVSLRKTTGFLAGRNFEVKFKGVKAAASDMLPGGWAKMQKGIAKAIPVLCAYKVGGSQFVFEQTVEFSRTRMQFGQAIGRFQRVQDMIIDLVNKMDAARWVTYEALWKLDNNMPSDEAVHMAKAVTSDAYWWVCNHSHQVFSGISYSREHVLSFHTRASRYLFNWLGDPVYHKQKLGKLLISQ